MKVLGKIENTQDAVSKEYVDGLLGLGSGGSDIDISSLVTKAEVIDNEEVHAAALNDLNGRVETLESNVSGSTATREELAEAIDSTNTAIVDNEEVHAAALNDLNGRIETLLDMIEEIKRRLDIIEGN